MLLITAATYKEVQPLIVIDNPQIGVPYPINKLSSAHLLLTGVGAAPTAYHLAWHLATRKYTHVLNLGIAGSYSPSLTIGDTVIVKEDMFADYGVDNKGEFLSQFEAWLTDHNSKPFQEGKLLWPYDDYFPTPLKKVKAITVAMGTGSEERVEHNLKRFAPEIETMEGAAVFYSCLMAQVPFICLRSISNRVEPRNRANWNVPLATENLCNEANEIIGMIVKEL